MEDFIFGTLATDELKHTYYRTEKLGIRHAYNIHPKAPKQNEPITLNVEIGPDLFVDQVACYYTNDGSNPEGSRGNSPNGKVVYFSRKDIEWDTLTWGYRSRWEAQLPPQSETKQLKYIISGWTGEGQEYYADFPDIKLTIEKYAKYYFDGKPLPQMTPSGNPQKPTLFQIDIDPYSVPDWLHESIIYHIFVDRFFPGKDRNWIQDQNLEKPFGGTLWGIADKMDYLFDLGITTLWLSPILPSPTIHRYDATNYFHVADELGGDQALHDLVRKAHDHGIRIILDLVCNHISSEHPYFKQALSNPNSKYRNWFYFDEEDQPGYRTFFGVEAMPQLNLDHPEARQWMFEIAEYWINEFNIDGYRLDHAMGPGPGFWNDFWTICKKEKADSVCIGEVVEPPDVQRQFYGKMDGLLDFHLCEAIRRSIGYNNWSKSRYLNFITNHFGFFPEDYVLASFLDNHDMDRFSFVTKNDKDQLKKAAEIQFDLPGPPIIYYGTEAGLQQRISKTTQVGLEASRGPMPWDGKQDKDLLAFYRDLIKKRKESKPWINRKRQR